ncbi:MAG: hypothetical protein FJZ01_10535 [Candidatus Sericytochromatia bacterium]|nr:hypothetical protein [Candidatus Tanganyikabacteria bacterium]
MSGLVGRADEILAKARSVGGAAGQDTVSLFGFRLRSTGFALLATVGQIQAIDQNARAAVKAVKQLDDAALALDQLGKSGQAAVDRTQADLEAAVRGGQAAQARYDEAVARYRGAKARLDREPRNRDLANQVAAAARAVNAAGGEIDRANEAIGRADKARAAALAERQTVIDAIAEFKRISTEVCGAIGKSMGLENVFFHENRFDPDKEWVDDKGRQRKGGYTNDVMTFGEKSESLLRTWAAIKDDRNGAVLVAWRKDKADEKAADPLNPVTRQAFQRTRDEEYDDEIEDEKTKEKKTVRMVRRLVLGDEAVIASKMGALAMYRKLFQRMMEDIVSAATRRHA